MILAGTDRTIRMARIGKPLALLALGSLLAAAGATGARAAEPSARENRVIADQWVLSLGSYLPEFRTDAAVGSGDILGTQIRAEDALGVDDSGSLFRGEGLYRFNRRHAIGFGYWSFNRNGDAAIDDEIEFDGNLYDVGAELETSIDTSWARVDWRYSFLRSERGETGISVGLSTYTLKMSLAGEASIDDGMGGTILRRERGEESVLAPVPTFGVFVNFNVTPTILFRAYANFINIDTGDLEGGVSETAFLFEWYPWNHAGFGGGLGSTEIHFKDVGTDPFSLDYELTGAYAYMTFAFGDVKE